MIIATKWSEVSIATCQNDRQLSDYSVTIKNKTNKKNVNDGKNIRFTPPRQISLATLACDALERYGDLKEPGGISTFVTQDDYKRHSWQN